MRRKAVIVSVTLSFAVLVLYTARSEAGHHITPYLLIAPVVGILAGLNYLRSTRR